jgi:curli biogenesis system outer membrane secretion channel CsgG
MRVASILVLGSVAMMALSGCGSTPTGVSASTTAMVHSKAAKSQLDQTQQQIKESLIQQAIANDAPLRHTFVDVTNIRYTITDQAGDYDWSAIGVTAQGQKIRLSGTFAAEDGEGLRVLKEGN